MDRLKEPTSKINQTRACGYSFYEDDKKPYLILGESHDGKYGTIETDTVRFVMDRTPLFWHEGQRLSLAAANFSKDFSLKPTSTKTWEPPASVFTLDEEIVMNLLGGTPASYKKYLNGQWDKTKTLAEVFVTNAKRLGLHKAVEKHKLHDALAALVKGTKLQELLIRPALAANIVPFITQAAIYMDGPTNKIKLLTRSGAGAKRELNLMRLLKAHGGIACVGNEHIAWMKHSRML